MAKRVKTQKEKKVKKEDVEVEDDYVDEPKPVEDEEEKEIAEIENKTKNKDKDEWPKEVKAAKLKEAKEDKKRGPIDAKCEICGYEVKVPHLRKNGCESCGHAGLREKK